MHLFVGLVQKPHLIHFQNNYPILSPYVVVATPRANKFTPITHYNLVLMGLVKLPFGNQCQKIKGTPLCGIFYPRVQHSSSHSPLQPCKGLLNPPHDVRHHKNILQVSPLCGFRFANGWTGLYCYPLKPLLGLVQLPHVFHSNKIFKDTPHCVSSFP